MTNGIFEILETASKITKREDKIKYLRENRSVALDTIVVGAFYPGVEWNLPNTPPPYRELDPINAETFLHFEHRRLYLFTKDCGKKMPSHRREALFQELLESVHPKDAQILIAMKDKKLPYKGLTAKLFDEAYPDLGLLEEQENEEKETA